MLNKLSLLAETVSHLKPIQIAGQIKNRLRRPAFIPMSAPEAKHQAKIDKPISKPSCLNDGLFTFLNITDGFMGWGNMEHGPLWVYNQNYMDWLEQEGIAVEECLEWIDKFIDELPANHIGQNPYPTALRIINWAKFFCTHPECLSRQRLDSMYAQALLLERKLEYHLLGNHLLEDSYALTIAAIYFCDEKLFRKASRLMLRQLDEQLLPDGAHYEQSPMYHCILLDRLLDCINFSTNNKLFDKQEAFSDTLRQKASLMLGHLQSIIYSDGSIPLLNDSAYGIAPTAKELFDYAQRLNISWSPVTLRECGYRKLTDKGMEAILDIGNITATYQPGHSHADTFNYELRIDGQPVIVDTGISTYNKDSRRQYERSTAAHNTVTVGGRDSSHVWGGFRVGRRAKVTLLKDTSSDNPSEIIASHNGFGNSAIHWRSFQLRNGALCIEDEILGPPTEAVGHLHFSPGLHAVVVSEADGLIEVDNCTVKVDGHDSLSLKQETASTEYNHLHACYVLSIVFTHRVKYTVTRKGSIKTQ